VNPQDELILHDAEATHSGSWPTTTYPNMRMKERSLNCAAIGEATNRDPVFRATTNERKRGSFNGKAMTFGRILCYGLLGATVLLLLAPTRSVAQAGSATINLLDPKNGGQIVVATKDDWLKTIDGNESNEILIDVNEWAVFAFKGERPAIFDTFAVLIPGKGDNVKEIELLAGDSPAGEFTSIGKFTTVNAKFVKAPYQEFKFPPVTAKYLKVVPLSAWSHDVWKFFKIYEFRLFGRLKE
jgi:hypothetical protein